MYTVDRLKLLSSLTMTFSDFASQSAKKLANCADVEIYRQIDRNFCAASSDDTREE